MPAEPPYNVPEAVTEDFHPPQGLSLDAIMQLNTRDKCLSFSFKHFRLTPLFFTPFKEPTPNNRAE